MSADNSKIVFFVLLAALFGAVTIWAVLTEPYAHWRHKLIRDTHHTVTIEGPMIRHDGIAIVRLKTPRGPEIAYLVDHGKYLAIGPLMDLKNGKNVTPIWERKYVS